MLPAAALPRAVADAALGALLAALGATAPERGALVRRSGPPISGGPTQTQCLRLFLAPSLFV
eukprot:6223476-Pyramimonas_sp.AAC.1